MLDDAIRVDAAARDYDPDDLAPVVKVLTPGQATRLGWSFLAGGVLLLAALFSCQGGHL
jgi:hypothetical protein